MLTVPPRQSENGISATADLYPVFQQSFKNLIVAPTPAHTQLTQLTDRINFLVLLK